MVCQYHGPPNFIHFPVGRALQKKTCLKSLHSDLQYQGWIWDNLRWVFQNRKKFSTCGSLPNTQCHPRLLEATDHQLRRDNFKDWLWYTENLWGRVMLNEFEWLTLGQKVTFKRTCHIIWTYVCACGCVVGPEQCIVRRIMPCICWLPWPFWLLEDRAVLPMLDPSIVYWANGSRVKSKQLQETLLFAAKWIYNYK